MKAYELFEKDQAGSEMRRQTTSRREYYTALRQALQDEANGLDECRLIPHVAKAVEDGQTEMYLLDAAAVWECYEAVIDRNLFPRDLSRGFPFKVKERTLPWSEVQRLSDAGTLPVAVVEGELRGRIEGLAAFMKYGSSCLGALPQVNPRAGMETMEAAVGAAVGAEIPAAVQTGFTGVPVSSVAAVPAYGQAAAVPAYGQPAQGEAQGTVAGLKRENQELAAENSLLRGQLEQMRAFRESEREYAVRAARSILSGHMEEARTASETLSEELKTMLAEMEQLVAGRMEMEQKLSETKARMEADVAQMLALRQQQEAAQQAAEEAQEAREKAQESARQAMEEKRAAEEEADKARQQLASLTQSLRQLRQRMVQNGEATELTQRQLEALSEFM